MIRSDSRAPFALLRFARRLATICAATCFILIANAKATTSDEQERTFIHLLDYLAKDYGGAVQNGRIVSESEYREQIEFSQTIVSLARTLPALAADSSLRRQAEALAERIKARASAETVAAEARALQATGLRRLTVALAPAQWPRLSHGRVLYAQNCASCHGNQGRGDGPAANGLDPVPANFHASDRMQNLSPLQAFNTIRLGVPGTAMTPYSQFSDADTWDLAFYVVALRHGGADRTTSPKRIEAALGPEALRWIARESDRELAARASASAGHSPADSVSEWRRASDEGETHASFALARTLLADAERALARGDAPAAKHLAIRAYLEGVEPFEPRLRSRAKAQLVALEDAMLALRTELAAHRTDHATASERASEAFARARATLDRLEPELLGGGTSPAMAAVSAGAIVLREGFEAVLILVALLGAVRASGLAGAARWIHGGWMVALALGVLSWFLSGWLVHLSGAGRENAEGVLSLTAVAILVAVGFWLHRRSESMRWQAFLAARVQAAASSGHWLGLATLSFIAVFRESIETVIFLRALNLDASPATSWALATGVITALIAVALLSIAMVRFSRRFPVRRIFSTAALIMALTALFLTGKGVHALQEAGTLSATVWPSFPRLELLGIFPTAETVLAQLAVLLIMLGIVWAPKLVAARLDNSTAP